MSPESKPDLAGDTPAILLGLGDQLPLHGRVDEGGNLHGLTSPRGRVLHLILPSKGEGAR